MTEVRFIDFTEQHRRIRDEVLAAVGRVFDSQQFVLREEVSKLEQEIARFHGVRHAIGVASGSDALYLALWALGVGPGDEVIVPPFTFFATAGAVSRTGARPVFADIEPGTFNIDPADIERRVTPRTKAVIPVHLFGLPCDMDAVAAVAKRHGLAVVEDAAQAFGASYKGRRTGSIGDAGCLSFFPTKNLGGAGDGGMALTSSDALAEKLRVLRVHGSKKKYHHEVVGINSRLDELQAAVLRVKLKYADEWNAARRRHAAAYDRGFAGFPVRTPDAPKGHEHVYHLYSILVDRRDELAHFLEERGIGTGVYYPLPLHLQPCYRELGYKTGDLPRSEEASRRILSLPIYPELTDPARERVIEAVREFFSA